MIIEINLGFVYLNQPRSHHTLFALLLNIPASSRRILIFDPLMGFKLNLHFQILTFQKYLVLELL